MSAALRRSEKTRERGVDFRHSLILNPVRTLFDTHFTPRSVNVRLHIANSLGADCMILLAVDEERRHTDALIAQLFVATSSSFQEHREDVCTIVVDCCRERAGFAECPFANGDVRISESAPTRDSFFEDALDEGV